MKKIPQSGVPVIPGTEQPRSLGDMLREAELQQAQEAGQASEQEASGQTTGQESGQVSAQKSGRAAGQAHGKSGDDRTGGAVAVTSSRPKKAKKVSRSQARRFARERALQALYQWDLSAGESTAIRKQFIDDQDMSRVDVDYFIKLFNGVSHNPDKVDESLACALDRPVEDIDPIERGVLRIAAYELTECPDIPARVVINEGIEITKRFGADKGFHYVNGVLDKLARAVRPLEMNRR